MNSIDQVELIDVSDSLVSVIMPAYNAKQFISETIESIIAQTYKNWELIIVDDGSTDNTAELIKEYAKADHRIKYVWQNNGRQGKARNNAIKNSTGEYLAFIDSDDLWLPEKLEHQLALIKKENVGLVFGYSYLIEHGIKTEKVIGRGKGKYIKDDAVGFLLYKDAFIMSTVLAKRDAIFKVELFVEELRIQYCEDWHLWLKLAFESFSFYTNSEVVSYYRLSDSSACSVEKEAQIKLLKALMNLNLRYPERSDLQSEIEKRIKNVIYHSPQLDKSIVSEMLGFMKKIHSKKPSLFLSGFLYNINVYLFRKYFLFVWRN